MTKAVANQRSYSDATSGVWFAPPGTAMPILPLPAAWPAGWLELGLLTDKGVLETGARQKTKSWNWQGGGAGRAIYSQAERSFGIECNEENARVLRLARPGSTPTTVGGINTTLIKAYTGTDYWMFGIDLVDPTGPAGPIHKRYVVPMGDATQTGSLTYSGTSLTVYAFTIDCYPDSTGTLFIDINDNPALAGDGTSPGSTLSVTGPDARGLYTISGSGVTGPDSNGLYTINDPGVTGPTGGLYTITG